MRDPTLSQYASEWDLMFINSKISRKISGLGIVKKTSHQLFHISLKPLTFQMSDTSCKKIEPLCMSFLFCSPDIYSSKLE